VLNVIEHLNTALAVAKSCVNRDDPAPMMSCSPCRQLREPSRQRLKAEHMCPGKHGVYVAGELTGILRRYPVPSGR